METNGKPAAAHGGQATPSEWPARRVVRQRCVGSGTRFGRSSAARSVSDGAPPPPAPSPVPDDDERVTILARDGRVRLVAFRVSTTTDA